MWPNPRDPDEPYWLPEDVAEVLGWRAHEASKCGRCGRHPDEWPADPHEDPPMFPDYHRCQFCQMTDELWREVPNEPSARDGLSVVLKPFDEDAFNAAEEQREAMRHRAEIASTAGLLEPE